MVRPEVVRAKLSQLAGYLAELEPRRDLALEDYVARGGPRREIERLLQLLVEVAVDTCTYVVAETEGTPPSSYRDAFARAAPVGLVPVDLAERPRSAAGLRNLLVHDYGRIDDSRVLAGIAPRPRRPRSVCSCRGLLARSARSRGARIARGLARPGAGVALWTQRTALRALIIRVRRRRSFRRRARSSTRAA